MVLVAMKILGYVMLGASRSRFNHRNKELTPD